MTASAYERAEACLNAGELDEALAVLTEHLASQPHDDAARRLCIDVRRRLGADQRAAALADLAALGQPTIDDRVLQAILLEQAGNLPAAAAAVGAALRERPFTPDLVERRARLLIACGRVADAIHLVDAMIMGRFPGAWRWRMWRGDARAIRRAYADAADDYSAALTELSTLPDQSAIIINYRAQLLIKRARAHAAGRNWAAAAADWTAAEELAPSDATIAFFRALTAYAAHPDAAALTTAIAVCRPLFDAAVPAVRAELRSALAEEEVYQPLAAALTIDSV